MDSMHIKLLDQRVSLRSVFRFLGVFIAVLLLCLFTFFYFIYGSVSEGFQAGLAGVGAAVNYRMGDGVKSSWENKTIQTATLPSGTALPYASVLSTPFDDQALQSPFNEGTETLTDETYNNLEQNVGGEIPLPEGELLFFAKNKFSPECCPSNYSNSSGCACATPEQVGYLNERGGNRTLVGEY
jgi:hypothetical protein